MEESVASEDGDKVSSEKISPKITRPKLPKFGSHTLGHVRHKTDPGKAVEIKNLMEEIKKWKDGSVFDKSIRPKIIKPQTIPKAHSTQTSPRASPPPGSPNFGKRGSSLNRNRSRSLKLLTDKLKSPRGGSKDTSLSPNTKIPKMRDENMRSKSADASVDNAPLFPENCQPPLEESNKSTDVMTRSVESDKEKTGTVEPIPEKDERDDEDEKCDKQSTSSGDTVGTPEKDGQKFDSKPASDSPKLGEEEGATMSDSDTPTTHVSTYTLHPIDRNSEFLRLRQTAPPKRRPGYAGLSLPKTKIPPLLKFQTDETKESADENSLKRVASAYDENSIKKPNRLDLLNFGGSTRKLSTPVFPSKRDECRLDLAGYNIFRSPSKECPPSLPGDESRVPCAGMVPIKTEETIEEGEKIEEPGATCMAVEQVVTKPTETESEKLEKRNGRSPKQKSKSDPSGNKSFDFDVSGVINSSQSFPFLQIDRMNDSVTEKVEDQNITEDNENIVVADKETSDLDVINNNHENENPEQQGSVSFSEPLSSYSGTEQSGSISEDVIFSPQSDMSEPFDEPGYQSAEETMLQSGGFDGLQRLETGGMSPVQEHEGDDNEGIDFATSVHSGGSESSTSTPISYSPTGTLEKPNNLLSVPSPKRPIARSVSSASVLQRERKYSASKDKDSGRKHSLTTVEDGSQGEIKTMDFLPIGDSGNIMASSMPSVWNADRHPSVSPERDSQYVKDKRYHIVEELYRNEKEYVEALKMLKERYMDPLKTVSGIDERVVDNIFYMIPEILTHHQIYLEFLNQVWTRWNTDTSTVGDIILKTFSGQTVQDSYLSFVENYKTSGKVIENALQTKSSVQKFVEQCQKESGSKLSLKDLIVRPIQRIPRYELLIQRLLVNTPGDHPDYTLLKEAEKAMHEFARKINSLNETQTEDGQQETLKKLELLLITDLAVPDRSYLRHDMVNIMNKKDQCCIWMFSDLIIISSVKRKSGPVTRKVSIILKSPTGQDFAENVKHKVWLKVGLDDIEIVKSQESLKKTSTLDKEQVEEDLDILEMVQDLANKLNCSHASLNDVVKEMTQSMRKQLMEHNLRESLQDSTKMELTVTTQEGVLNLEVNFTSGEKRAGWEATFLDAKQKLSLLSDKRAAEFLQPLQITKTRAGMQFSCAAPIDGVNSSGYRDVWVCNSDGYVGHMCLLSLQPEPIVTLNTPVPGCNARILCIAAVPAHAMLRRKSSAKQRYIHNPPSPTCEGPRISIEEVDVTDDDGNQGDISESGDVVSEDGYQSDSSSSEETDDEFISTRSLFVEEEEQKRPPPTPPSKLPTGNPESFTTSGSWTQNPAKSTMWLGTEDGCIHIFQCTDNIKTTKNKLKIQLGYPVYCILYLDNKVFVSLSNGDLMVYRRDSEGTWDSENPYTRAIGSVTAPIVKMLAVAGKLWCGRQNNICVINPLTLSIEKTFQVHQDSNRCVQCIVNAGHGVWIASQQSAKVILYHATTFEFLLEVSIAQAVNQKLQAADDIIRQHKAACLRITALLVCKDLLWIGTSAGVILTIPIPKITSTTTRGSLTTPNVTGLVYGHTGHVRFLTCVEMVNTNVPPLLAGSHSRSDSANNNTRDPDVPSPQDLNKRRSSVATMTAALATRMLVISGGDGYEDFRTNVVNEAAGKDDSTNHLLLWQV
ncbi:rho guanine nucleotide exchange factor 17-like [Mercenaria mercenaria]|uniref:rho guanine nucleotide exchange factor 17-like n=1 Tax=Mercenaria mercenaria TaxID=6596 RepID=UPI00234EFE30|nr:rho guanine nucleotide exchange factor 17-like [Mercenaria mercenaria]